MSSNGKLHLIIKNDHIGQRLDTVLSQLLPEVSRSGAANLIRNKKVKIDDIYVKPGYRLKGGERVDVVLEVVAEPSDLIGQAIPLDIIHEDEDIIVINKEAGMVVHPAPGNYQNTLANALIHRFPKINSIGMTDRPGIVHRLDKDTSGVMVAAKTQMALTHLANQFQTRSLTKKYLALVWGNPKDSSGKVTDPIGRHPTDRKRMSIHSRKKRNAETLWKVKEHFRNISLLEIEIKTGRTHQIRVHCASIHHPVVGDPIYGGKKNVRLVQGLSQNTIGRILKTRRQMLHAWTLSIVHPRTQMPLRFKAQMPKDMKVLVESLKKG